MFIEFGVTGGLADRIAHIVGGGYLQKQYLLFLTPLYDGKVMHVNVACAARGLLCIGELSGTLIVRIATQPFGMGGLLK